MNTGQVAVLLGLAFSGVAICLISTMPQNSSCPIAPTDTYGPLVWKLGSLFVSMGVACFFWVMMNRFIHPKSVLLGKENPLSNNTNNTAPNNPSPQIPAIPFTATGVIALFLLIFFLIGFNVKIG
ncbi:hypothetical protein COB72_05565 [bacterium]|nr:MAG: hypothetical protein COB72_05565 [bacterium]